MLFVSHRLWPLPEGDQALSLAGAAAMECVQLGAVAIATAALAAIERRPLFSFGLQGDARARRFFGGLVCGIVAISVLVLTLRQAGFLHLDAPTLQGGRAVGAGVIWAVIFLMTGVFEETLLRGYLQYTLTRWLGFWWGALLLSALFGAMHGIGPGETPVGLVVAMLFGLVFCLSLWYTGSLWWAIGFHAAWDWGESFLYGASDSGRLVQDVLFTSHPAGNALLSGGVTGPEGSVLVFAVLAIVAIVIRLWWRRGEVSPFARRGRLAGGDPAQ